MPARRVLVGLLVVSVGLGASACQGDTDPADFASSMSVRMNAHGRANDGPARWWWEYDTVKAELGTANDTEVCGPLQPLGDVRTTRCGPAGPTSDNVNLNVEVNGLASSTTYHFRACGQDTNDTQPTCGQIRSFTTKADLVGHSLFGTIATPGSGNGQFSQVGGIALDFAGNLYVADIGNDRIQVFNSSLSFIRKWGSFGSANAQFRDPVSVDVDRTGNVYVADQGNRLIKKFTPSGSFSRSWPPTGSTADLKAVAVDDAADKIYVLFTSGSNPALTRIEKYNSSGVLEDSASVANGAEYLAASENRVYVTGYSIGMCQFDSHLNVTAPCATGPRRFRGIAFEPSGGYYVGHISGSTQNDLFSQHKSGVGSIYEGNGTAAAVAADAFGNVVVVEPPGTIRKWWQKF